nr:hypothetical protein [Pandoravirus belohorizontensis]
MSASVAGLVVALMAATVGWIRERRLGRGTAQASTRVVLLFLLCVCVGDEDKGVHKTASAGKDRVADPVRPWTLFVRAGARPRARTQPSATLWRTNGVRVHGAALVCTDVQTGQAKGQPRTRSTASAFWPSSLVDNGQCRRF